MLLSGRRVREAAAVAAGLAVLTTTLGAAAPATDMLPRPADPAAPAAVVPYPINRGERSATRAVRRDPPAPIAVMSFNVCGGVCHHGEVPKVAAFVAQTARKHNAEAVMLQELCASQFTAIRKLLPSYNGTFAATTKSADCGGAFGIAVFVRGTLTDRTVRALPTPPGVEKRVLQAVTTSIAGRRTLVAAVHLSPSPAAGLEGQLAAVAKYLNPKATHPLIVAGDFNSLPDNPGLGALYSSTTGGTGPFREADEDHTGHPERGGAPTFDTAARKIDYVFLSDRWFTATTAVSLPTAMSDHHVYIAAASPTR
jgi:endonuclease/exonuclease/phosphatase family metal-dependent hydrolase